MSRIQTIGLFVGAFMLIAAGSASSLAEDVDKQVVRSTSEQAVAGYIDTVRAAYGAALADAVELKRAVDRLVASPSAGRLKSARGAWLKSRQTYGRTEVFRFYGGPIDDRDGPEHRLNAWPVDEAYIDAVRGRPDSGIIQDPSISIDPTSLSRRNGTTAETDVTLGFHAVEFLLWGQDFSKTGAGDRTFESFAELDPAGRRCAYLKVVTAMLVDDLQTLVSDWSEREGSFAKQLALRDPDEALADFFRGMSKLAGFEMAMERLAVPLDSGEQEDEHSCFSDNTHNDFLHNWEGIRAVYSGLGHGQDPDDERRPAGLSLWLADRDPELDAAIRQQLDRSGVAIRKIHRPFDALLTLPSSHPSRAQAERLIDLLAQLGDLFDLARASALRKDQPVSPESRAQ